MRNTARANKAATTDDDSPRWFVLQALSWSHKDAIAFGIGALATVTILVNGLMLQTGAHPAPMFKGSLVPAAPAVAKEATTPPSARPAEPTPVKAEASASARPTVDIITDIQRELTRRGFYDGTVDGRYGPRTDAAVRDFEHAAGLKPNTEPNEALLAAIKRSNAKPTKATSANGSAGRPVAQPVRLDPIAELLAPSKRVLAVQRALAEYGYGQIKPTGTMDNETRAAVEKFERERKLPITGQVSDRVIRELAAITGRPLE